MQYMKKECKYIVDYCTFKIYQNIGVELPGTGREPEGSEGVVLPASAPLKGKHTLSETCLCLWGRGITNLA